jgi:hypothetical protein
MVEAGGRIIPHPLPFGKVFVEPGRRIYVCVEPIIGERVSGYMLEKQRFLEFFEAVKEQVSTQPVELELKPEEIVNNHFVEECKRNNVPLN